MRALAIFGLSLIVSVSALVEVQTNYHDSVGIPEAERIWLLEEDLLKNDVADLEPQDNRIVGGVLAPVSAHPYFVSILRNILLSVFLFCHLINLSPHCVGVGFQSHRM